MPLIAARSIYCSSGQRYWVVITPHRNPLIYLFICTLKSNTPRSWKVHQLQQGYVLRYLVTGWVCSYMETVLCDAIDTRLTAMYFLKGLALRSSGLNDAGLLTYVRSCACGNFDDNLHHISQIYSIFLLDIPCDILTKDVNFLLYPYFDIQGNTQ